MSAIRRPQDSGELLSLLGLQRHRPADTVSSPALS
jgi:hypothetical protein